MAQISPIRERRFYPRVPCDLIDSKKQSIRNISQNGLYLESREDHPLEGEIQISFFLPPADQPMRLRVRVARKESMGARSFGYGLSFKNLASEDFKNINYFVLYQTTRQPTDREQTPAQTRFFYKTIVIETQQQNLTAYDPRLGSFLQPSDFFSLHDLTKDLQAFVDRSGVQEGQLLVQVLHTSATLCVNELDEPMLLMDLVRKLRALVPKEGEYLHNSPLREVNLCADDTHCDRNGDAHVKASLFGYPSVNLIVKNGRLTLGQWQKVALIEFDGPRRREVLVQLMGC